MVERKATITAEYETPPAVVTSLDGVEFIKGPGVFVSVTFEIGRQDEALDALAVATADVARQISEVPS